MNAPFDRLTVVVPSYNRPEQLRHCLHALTRCEDGPRIIVVDDGSTIPLEPVCQSFGDGVRYLRQANTGPAAARNRGALAAETPFVAFTDDDCLPRPDWAHRMLEALETAPDALIGGRVLNGLPDNVYAAASQSLCDFLYNYFDADTGGAQFFTSNNIACLRERFLELGGFDQSFPLAAAEDRDLGLRWRKAGGDLVYAQDALVEHRHRLDLARFWRQHGNYGRGARHLHRVMVARGDATPRFQGPQFYAGLLAYPLLKKYPRAAAQCALMALSQAAMLAGYFAERRQEERPRAQDRRAR